MINAADFPYPLVNPPPELPPIPYGYCYCGCGRKTEVSPYSSKALGYVKGEPRKLVKGHQYPRPLHQRLLQKIDVRGEDECWEFQAARTKAGYGLLQGEGVGSLIYAHRAVFDLFVRPLEEGEQVLHECDNPPCCNPKHLSAGTHTDNQQDKERKGRANHPPRRGIPKATLDEDKVRDVLRLLNDGHSQSAISRMFNVTPTAIYLIASGKRWSHVSRENL